VRLQVLLALDHPLAQGDEISLIDLADEPAALLALQPAQDLVETILRSAGFEPNIKWRSQNAETVRSLVGRGLAYSIMMTRPPNDRTHEGRPLAYRRISDDLPDNALVLGCPHGVDPSGKVRALIDFCRTMFSAPDMSTAQIHTVHTT
jgi:DNA-binding transcriptional LysR family regulator